MQRYLATRVRERPKRLNLTGPSHIKRATLFRQLRRKNVVMPSFTIHFDDDDTTANRMQAMANELGIPVDALIHRAISEHLGTYGLTKVDPEFKADGLRELFQAHGLLKSVPK
jgi:hypothetical protein